MEPKTGRSFIFEKSRIAGLTWGKPDAPTWLALHGWMDNAASFSRVAPLLVEHLGIRIIAIDFSGHGLSYHHPVRSEYSMWSFCHDALDALEELGIQKATIMGHSLGAGVGSILAATYPEMVKKLILIDGLLGRLLPPNNLVDQLRRGLSAQRRQLFPFKTIKTVEGAVEERVLKSLIPIEADAAYPIVRRNLDGNESSGYKLRIDRQITAPRPVVFTQEQAIEILRKIRCRCLLIQGVEGIIPKRDPHGACRNAIHNLTLAKINGGHHLHLERENLTHVAETIIKWNSLESIKGGS